MYDADMNYANNQDSSHKNLKPRLCVEIETLTHDLYNTERLKPDILWNPDSVCGLGLETLSDLIFFHTHTSDLTSFWADMDTTGDDDVHIL